VFADTFSPVIRHSSLRTLLSIALETDMQVTHFDVKSAFLHGELNATVYLSQPPGFVTKGKERHVYQLHKSLYGLIEANRVWNEVLDDILLLAGFTRLRSEVCVYRKDDPGGSIFVAVYVDDILHLCPSKSLYLVTDFEALLKTHLEITNLGPVSYFLGWEISRTSNTLTIHQSKYISDLLSRFGMSDCKPVHTPMDPDPKSDDGLTPDVPYRELLGGLLWLATCTRPDISYAVGFIARSQSAFKLSHWMMLKRILRYLKHTPTVGLTYTREPSLPSQVILDMFCDADHSTKAGGKSTSGILLRLSGNTVAWRSAQQPVVALSSAEAEYYALSDGMSEGLWLRYFLSELGFPQPATRVFEDNQGTIRAALNAGDNLKRMKHIDIRHHFIRDYLHRGDFTLEYIPTSEQLADLLTKSLGRSLFERLRSRILGPASG
jgi:hypothetical protein